MTTKTTKINYTSIQTIFILCVLLFWGVPFLKDILPQKDAQDIVMGCIQLINPIFCIVLSYLHYRSEKFSWFLPIGFMMIFLPLPFLFYEVNTLIYVPIYGACAILGWLLSNLTKNVRH